MRTKAAKPFPRLGDVWERAERGRIERVVVLGGAIANTCDECPIWIVRVPKHPHRPMRSRPMLKTFWSKYRLVSRAT